MSKRKELAKKLRIKDIRKKPGRWIGFDVRK